MSDRGSPMLAGVHQASYAANSTPQNLVLLRCRPMLENAIAIQQAYLQDLKHQRTPTSNGHGSTVFRIADLGSSSGPNCLANMSFMLDALAKHRIFSSDAPQETHFFFCDLASNDFNTLFQLLRDEFPQLMQNATAFGSAVAGTVHGRLFPTSSIHFFFSSCCLHWLSQIPTSILDPTAREWNKGKIWVDAPQGNAATGKAYVIQWQKDMRLFLEARSAEMVPDGMLFLVFLCRPDAFPPHQMQEESCFRYMEVAWQQLAHEGMIDHVDLDTFNLSFYLPTLEEITSAIDLGPTLKVHSVEVVEEAIGQSYWQQWSHDPREWAMREGNFYRSLFSNLIGNHVGNAKSETIFQRFQELLETSMKSQPRWDSYWVYPWCLYAIVQIFKA